MATEVRPIEAQTPQPSLKPLKGYQTNCDGKDAKGKPCWGPLKIWHTAPAELRQLIPPDEVIYRCQQCWQLYHGRPHQHVHRATTRP